MIWAVSAALCVSVAGNVVLGAALYRLAESSLRMLPEHRERATAGTARVYSPWRKEKGKGGDGG